MIVIDDVLESGDRAKPTGDSVLDLTQVARSRERVDEFISIVLEWIDSTHDHRLNGLSYFDFFDFRGHSYWMHVRARLFYVLMTDAQLLARLPDPTVLSQVSTVYCDPASVDFWNRWTPNARKITRQAAPEVRRVSLSRALVGLSAGTVSSVRRVARAISSKPEGVCYSMARHNRLTKRGIRDIEIGGLLKHGNGKWLRLEFRELPRQDGELPPEYVLNGSHIEPTINTKDLLTAFLVRHPGEIPSLVSAFRILKNRLTEPVELTFRFKRFDGEFKRIVTAEMARLAPSIVLFDVYFRAFRWLLDSIKPTFAFATGENNGAGRTFVDAARDLGIPSFGVQHGVIAPHNIDYRFSREDAEVGSPDYYFVWGEGSREYLTQQSHYDPDQTFAVGQARLDEIQPIPNAEMLDFGAQTNCRTMLFASQPQKNLKNRAEAALELAAFCERNELACVVKLHPGEEEDFLYQRTFTQIGRGERLRVIDGDLHDMIEAADIGGTCFSTVAWEIMSTGTPLVVIDPSHSDLLRLENEPSVLHLPTSASIEKDWWTHLEIHARTVKSLGDRMMGLRDGKASERMAGIIQTVVSQA